MDMTQLPKLLNGTAEARRIRPVKCSINENITPLSTASMTILKEDVFPERSWVELFTPNGSAGIYRTRAPETGYSGDTVTVTLEHGICEVGDWLVREKTDSEQKTLAAAVQRYFSFYGGSRWQLGSVSVSGNVVVSSSYQNVLSAILSAMQQVSGAMLAFNFTTTPWTVSIVSRGTTVSAEGRLSRNVTNAKIKKDDSGLVTRVWMEGLGTNGAVGHMDADTISTYGVVEAWLSGRNYTQAQAQTVASAYLARRKRPIYSITIDGIDLSHITGETLDRIEIGKKYRLAIPEDSTVIEETVTAIRWTDVYDSPGQCTVSLAEPEETVITFLQAQQQATDSRMSSMQSEYSSGIAEANASILDTQEDVDLIWRKTGIDSLGQQETLYTRIQINAEAIQTEATRAQGEEITMSTRITQTAEAITREAERAITEEGKKLNKTTQYPTVNSILTRAQTLANNAERNAKNASIVKTIDYQSADEIYTAALRAAETSAGNLYVTKTLRYQSADAIVDAAEAYVDDELQSYSTVTQTAEAIQVEVTRAQGAEAGLSSRIDVQAGKVSLVVDDNGIKTASIVAGINGQSGSYVKIKADAVDIEGIVHATNARIDNIEAGLETCHWLVTETLDITSDFYMGGQSHHFIPTQVTIGGTSYTILAHT